MQVEITIKAFNPTEDPNHFVADVYVNGQRVSCGTGKDQTVIEAIKGASNDVKFSSDVANAVKTIMEDNGYKQVIYSGGVKYQK